MTERLATEYMTASLTLTKAEMIQLEHMLTEHAIVFRFKVLDNGMQQLVFYEDLGTEVVICFQHKSGFFISEGSYRFNTLPLANLMRSAVSLFKGNAIVNRIYTSFNMIYYYERGVVVKIVEMNEHYQKTIYEFRNAARRLEQLFQEQKIEIEIRSVQDQINLLLDERNRSISQNERVRIDSRLTQLTNRLFALEA